MKDKIKVIAFDADDTLWENEPYFRAAEQEFCSLIADLGSFDVIMEFLYDSEIQNLKYYGYGIKGFMLSMLDTYIHFSGSKLDTLVVNEIVAIGKRMMEQPVIVLDDIPDVLEYLTHKYKLVMVTKGDLFDQEKKLQKSGLEKYFHHIEIVSEKTPEQYQALLKHLDIKPEDFVMIGNSLKSDIIPVRRIGAYAIHIPFHTTWIHERMEVPENMHYVKMQNVKELLKLFK